MTHWRPGTEEELALAISSRSVHETHSLDFKKQVVAGNDANAKVAADMAAMAIDGGFLIIGVDEPNDDEFALAPQPLADFAERIEQVARNRVDPPLDVRAVPIRSAGDPTVGYLVVEIPPSPAAPHLVDGVFWARGEKTNFRMSSAEVARHLVGREAIEDRIRDALREEVNRDPHPQPQSRAFLVAVPLTAPADVASDFIGGSESEVVEFTAPADTFVPPSVQGATSGIQYTTNHERRHRALARTTLGPNRTMRGNDSPEYVLDVEVKTSGSIRVLVSNTAPSWSRGGGAEAEAYIAEDILLAWAHRLVGLSVLLADRTGYRGSWGFGIFVYGIGGLRSIWQTDQRSFTTLPTYNERDFEEVAVATLDRMRNGPWEVVSDLLNDLVVSLGVRRHYLDALEAPAPAGPGKGE